MPAFVPTHTVTLCLSLLSRRAAGDVCSCSEWPCLPRRRLHAGLCWLLGRAGPELCRPIKHPG